MEIPQERIKGEQKRGPLSRLNYNDLQYLDHIEEKMVSEETEKESTVMAESERTEFQG